VAAPARVESPLGHGNDRPRTLARRLPDFARPLSYNLRKIASDDMCGHRCIRPNAMLVTHWPGVFILLGILNIRSSHDHKPDRIPLCSSQPPSASCGNCVVCVLSTGLYDWLSFQAMTRRQLGRVRAAPNKGNKAACGLNETAKRTKKRQAARAINTMPPRPRARSGISFICLGRLDHT
jgi:hypothetical protein